MLVSMNRVLVLANEHVNQKMAGPSIRSYELSLALVREGLEVMLGSPFASDRDELAVPLVTYDESSIRHLASWADVILLQGWVMERFPWLASVDARVVVDLYDPFPLEVLVLFERYSDVKRAQTSRDAVKALARQMARGDFFMCASEKQRDYWMGWLTAAGRINPRTYDTDPSLRQLIDVVPFGIPGVPPIKRHPGVREAFPGIGDDDPVLLWGGGVYNWFDPVTLIRAVAEVAERRINLRLVFMSTGHPNPDIQPMWTMTEARRIADQLGLTNRNVFFNDTWIPYAARADWLLDSDIGVSIHFDHVETRFSFRTRILDYFWAGMPVICTEGDTLADTIESEGLGIVTKPEDVASVAEAIERLVGDRERRADYARRVKTVAARFTWHRAAEPLVQYCGTARPAADRMDHSVGPNGSDADPDEPSTGDKRKARRPRLFGRSA